nr:hypothetical protein [Tanacetum cinerariifolium]
VGSNMSIDEDGSTKVKDDENSKFFHGVINSRRKSQMIQGRQILDGPLIISEFIDWYKKQKKKMMLFKVDFEKAFESVSWRFLDHVSEKLGLRQGDTLSPFLLIIVLEGLHIALKDGLAANLFRGVKNLYGVWVSSSEIDRMDTGTELIDRFKARLSGWKANLLSICGWLTLIKLVLGSLGIYYLSIFKAPEAVIKALEILRALFFGAPLRIKRI